MATCPYCQKIIDSQALRCPHCTQVLKGYGHPGVPLHQAAGDSFLCADCVYHEDDSCNFPQRPYAKNCILYQNPRLLGEKPRGLTVGKRWQLWSSRNRGWLLFIGLIIISIILASL
jgi:hypothetical protein